jgi:hypothetical protein
VQVNVELSGVDGAGGSTKLMQINARFSGVDTGGITYLMQVNAGLSGLNTDKSIWCK